MSNENKIRILYVQPGKYPEERLVTNELPPLQRLVGGDSAHHGQQQIGGRAGRPVPLYARPAGHFAPAAFRGNASQPACSVRRDCRCRWRVVLAAAGAHLSSLPTAAQCWSAAGTTATAIRYCWITARACHTLCPYDANCRYRR